MRYGQLIVPVTGLLILLAHAPADAGPDAPPQTAAPEAIPDDRLGVRTAPLLLLSRTDVQTDLGLTPKQIADVRTEITRLHAQALATKGMKGAQAVAARKAIDVASQTWIDSNLTADQVTRLVQISLQWEGPSALITRPVVADTLGLTADQRAALTKAVKERDAARALPTHSKADERKLAEQALSLLDATQKERWKTMLGRPFTPRLASQAQDNKAAR